MIFKKKRGYLLIEAILASALISAVILFRTQVEARHKETDNIRKFATDVVAVPYAIDKRTLLDGHTLNLPKKTFTGAQDTFLNLLKQSLIGTNSAACRGGWAPKDTANGALNLISCTQFNYKKMPFNFEMDGGYELATNGAVSRYYIDLYHKNSADFNKNSHVYPQLINFSRLLDSPQITGSHKYSLIHKASKKELTPSQCLTAKQQCAIRAEYFTNFVGLGEDVYLRVNGSNFMLSSIRFKGLASAPYECSKITPTGSASKVPCGIEFTPPTSPTNGELVVNSDSTNSQSVNLANNKIKNSGGSVIPVKCQWDRRGTITATACGMSVVSDPNNSNKVITRAALHEISSLGSIYTINETSRTKTFEVQANSGDVKTKGNIAADGKISSKKGVDLSYDITSTNKNKLLIDQSKVEFDGALPQYKRGDAFAKTTGRAIPKELAKELVTKGYMHSFNQIIDISVKNSGSAYSLYRCPNGQYASVIGFPYNSTLISSETQINRVCPYSQGRRLPRNTIRLSLSKPTVGQVIGNVRLTSTIGCRWEGDYAQAWFMNENKAAGRFIPRFYLVSPRRYGGGVANIEVKMKFSTIQYCGTGGLQ